MQSAIVQKVSGQSVLDFLRPRLFEPLGIERPEWEANFQGVSLGGYGLRVGTEDIAKFGQLYLQKGKWEGKQLMPSEWVEMATAKQTSNGSNPQSDWNQGYGFQFWRCRHNAYRGDGAFGQYCVVLPEQDAVIAITSGVKDMQGILNILWNHLLPALQARSLPANAEDDARLKAKLGQLKVPAVEGSATSASSGQVLNRKFGFASNDQKLEQLTLGSTDGGQTLKLTMQVNGKESVIPCGYREWKRGRAALSGGRLAQFEDEPVAGTFAWSAADTCLVKFCAYETPYHFTMKLKFDRDQVTVGSEANVAFGSTRRPELVGHAQ
jgi:hypothetical protein